MIYVMSDIHGSYDKYLEMLDLINFCDDDVLYILGDLLDRGDKPLELVQDIMHRTNVYPTMGNHDLLACDILLRLGANVTAENYRTDQDEVVLRELQMWLDDGGESTFQQYLALSKTERFRIVQYLAEMPLIEIEEINDNIFIMCHAGLGNFQKDKKIEEYTLEDVLVSRNNPDVRYFEDDSIFMIWGHTPTRAFSGKDEIYRRYNNFCIDCGAAYGGKLACLCLNTFEAYYV